MNDRLHPLSPSSNRVPPTATSSSAASPASFAPQRSLSDDEIRSIFEVLYQNDDINTVENGVVDQANNEPPLPPFPNGIPFSIVPCGSHCEKLSPPPYTFSNGLYVLLRPTKKVTTKKVTPTVTMPNSSIDRLSHSILDTHDPIPLVPPHLQRYPIWTTAAATAAKKGTMDCKWRLSGPQFPPPTAIQQRYCYPITTTTTTGADTNERGDDDHVVLSDSVVERTKAEAAVRYCDSTGGALYTMYSATTGKELFDYRLLHVYYSSKRAGNKGVVVVAPQDPTAAAKGAITTSPSLAMQPWSHPNQSHGTIGFSKKKLKRQATDPFISPTKTLYHQKRTKSSSTPNLLSSSPSSQKQRQYLWNDSSHCYTTMTESHQYGLPYMPTHHYYYPYPEHFSVPDAEYRETHLGQPSDGQPPQQQQQHSNYNTNYGYGSCKNDPEFGVVRRGRYECGSVYIPTSPADDFTGTKIGVSNETPKFAATTVNSSKNDWNHDTANSNNSYYNHHSQSPSPFRCPIRINNSFMNRRNTSPLFSTGIHATTILDDLDQYSNTELTLSHTPSFSSSYSSLSLQQTQYADQRKTHDSHYNLDDDDSDDSFSIKPTAAIRHYDIDTILSFPNDPFTRTSSYDEFDNMMIGGTFNNAHDCSKNNTAATPFYHDFLPPTGMLSDDANANQSSILNFQSTLNYVQDRIREHILMSSSSCNQTGSEHDPLLVTSWHRTEPASTVSLAKIVTSWAHNVAQNPLLLQQQHCSPT